MHGEYCHKTGKAKLDETAAKAILDADIYRNAEGRPRNYYWCTDCESYHLTSQAGKRYYRKKVRIREKFKHILTGD